MSTTGSELEDLPYDKNDEEEEEEEEEEVEIIEEEQQEVYNSADFISGPFLSEECTLPQNILEFDYSFGYDCKRYYNLTVADEETLIFASGNFINIFNVNTKEFTFRRSALGGGIGHITKNPNSEFQHIAVAENGHKPPIIIYEWPSLEIVTILKQGSEESFTHLNYSPNGMLLGSQGGAHDFLITIFDWTKSKILLRTKSNVHEVYRVMFSPDVPGQLTSSGLTHIKFWKMAETFTGLKLQGELGRFGKTEYCDILGIYPMPDEKVVSGCAWGNILVWDEGLIKFEVCRKLRKPCHEGPITQFYYSDGDLWSVGMDGRVCVWFYDTIDQADPPDDDRFVQVEPVYNFHTPGVQFMCVYKRSGDPLDTFYFAQDGNGGLWKIDLNVDADPLPSEQLYKCHAGMIADIAACPWGPFLVSLGDDGRLQLYNYELKRLLFIHQYPAKGAALIWLPLNVQESGDLIFAGFDDGNLRVVVIDIASDENEIKVTTIQIIKPHNKPITKMIINDSGSVLVTGGEDKTIFIFTISKENSHYAHLIPIGYIFVPGIVTYLTWHHNLKTTVLVGCIHGHFVQVEVPKDPQPYTTVTYVLKLEPKTQRFTTYKAQIRRNIKIAEIDARKAAKVEKKRIELERVKAENPGLDIDEELFLADSDSEEKLEPLHIPDVPNRILWLETTDEGTIWLSMAGYDAGYIYEYDIDQTSEIPLNYQIIYDGDDIEMNCHVYNSNKEYLILAMQDGAIKVVSVNPDDWRDFSNYWQLSMHDNHNGFVPRMCFSYNEDHFFSCGHDGNIFSYKFLPESVSDVRTPSFTKHLVAESLIEVKDVDGYINLSLEEAIVKAEMDRQQRIANEHKQAILEQIVVLKERFEEVLVRNDNLPPTQIIPRKELEIDPRITAHLKERLEADMALVKRKLAFDVEKSEIGIEKLKNHFTNQLDLFPITVRTIETNTVICTARQRKLSDKLDDMLELVEQKIIEAELKGRPPERPPIVQDLPPPMVKKEKQLEYFLIGLSPSTLQFKLGAKLTRLLQKYRARKLRLEDRQLEWNKFKNLKPVEGVNDPRDETELANAIETIGDFKLKSAPDYKVPRHLRESTVKKYKQLLLIRQQQFNIRHNYNRKVHEMREKKVQLRGFLLHLTDVLNNIHQELPESDHKFGPPVPQISNEEFPEKNLEVIVELPPAYRPQQLPQRKQLVKPPKGELLEKMILTVVPKEVIKKERERLQSATNDPEAFDFSNDYIEEDTPWEAELREYRKSRKLLEQNLIISKMKRAIEKFDKELDMVFHEQVQTLLDANFMDLQLLTVHQELIIIKEFESVEEGLQAKVHSRMEDMLDMRDLINKLNNRTEGHKREIDRLQETEKAIQKHFFTVVADNKFYDFLRRIFRKKYKPPKVYNPDDSSSSSESSSSSDESEDDTKSVDSRNFNIIRLDESVCPKGCDQRLFDLTYELRTQRHGVELEIKEQKTSIELIKKELEINFKRIKVIENNLKISQDELEAYQREKQRKLNEVNRTVIVKMHQLQHLISENKVHDVGDTLVFSQHTLSKLYKRVGELYNETLQQKAKHKTNITHLCRMRTDCKHMEKTIVSLKEQIVEQMKRKFGREVDIDELEEVQLKRMVFDLKLSMLDFRKMYERELERWTRKYVEKQDELARAIEDNTARLEVLAMINREKTDLASLIDKQHKKREHMDTVVDVAEEYKQDIKKLSVILNNQCKELQLLQNEIKRLKMKGMAPTKLLFGKIPEADEEEEEDEEDVLFWQGWDYISKERQPKEEKPDEIEQTLSTTEVQIPPVISDSSEEMAKTIILEMLEAMEPFEDMSKHVLSNFVDEVVTDVLNRCSVIEIIKNLIALLPDEPTEKQHSIIEFAAEQLYALPNSQEQPNEDQDANTVLEEILHDADSIEGEPHTIMTTLLTQLVNQLPLSFLTETSSINLISKKQEDLGSINKDALIQSVSSLTSDKVADVQMLLDKLLENVYGV